MKIVFCIPGKKFSGTFLSCWTQLIKKLQINNIEWAMVNGYVPNISMSRQALLDRARMHRPTHYMWIDDDQVFTYEQFEKLLDRDLNIISGIYKKSPELFACCKLNGETLTIRDEMFENKEGVNEVMANGMGFMLVKKEVFDGMYNPFDFLNENQWEDFGFADKARQLGYKVNIDNTVIVGHEKLMTI
tara:strand:+ start:491 stop:1054 length:564 start_codon:yes stop_codon:yes gene_type:complete